MSASQTKYGTTWQVVCEITNKKLTPVINVKGNTSGQGSEVWLKHFKSQLDETDNKDHNSNHPLFKHKISKCLLITTSPFEMSERKK